MIVRRCVPAILLLALALNACAPVSSGLIKIYVSLPLESGQGESIHKAIRLALKQAGWSAGGFRIELTVRTDSEASGQWDAAREEANAREAVADPDVAAYLGPVDSGAAVVSTPVTNRGGLVQISPSTTSPALTKSGFYPGQPGEFYPTGRRNYFRTCPTDDAQGPAAAIWARALGFETIYILDDGDVYGSSIAGLFEDKALDVGLAVLGHQAIDRTAADFAEIVRAIGQADPDLVFFGGTTENGAPRLIRQLREAGVRAAFMVPDGAADTPFIQQAGPAAEGVWATQVGVPPQALVTEAGQSFYLAYQAEYGEEPEPLAQFGYDAARVVLDAIERARVKDRRAILEAVAATRDFAGTGGTFRFDRNGDTTLTTISGIQVEDGKFEFVATLNPGR